MYSRNFVHVARGGHTEIRNRVPVLSQVSIVLYQWYDGGWPAGGDPSINENRTIIPEQLNCGNCQVKSVKLQLQLSVTRTLLKEHLPTTTVPLMLASSRPRGTPGEELSLVKESPTDGRTCLGDLPPGMVSWDTRDPARHMT